VELAIQIVGIRLEANQRASQFFDQPETHCGNLRGASRGLDGFLSLGYSLD
jgi:hypothetical protein